MAKVSTKVCNKYTPANSSTKILTSKGWINIEHIKQGNFVLTHTGKFRRVLKIDSYLSESQKTIIGGNLAYDNKSGQLKIASNNVSLLTFAGWQNIVDIQIGQTVQLLAGTCKTCKKQIAFYRNYCSKSCASFATASGQWQREEHRESVSNKRRELMEKHNNRLPYLEKYLQAE